MKISSILILTTIFAQSAYSEVEYLCENEAEQAVHEYTTARTEPARLQEITAEGHQVFEVRTNLHGGDAAYKITVDSNCKTVSIEELWAE